MKREPRLYRSNLRRGLLVLLIYYAALSYLPSFLYLSKAQSGQDERGLGVRVKKSEQKIALVIGNNDYGTSIGKLKNPTNDAADIAAALNRLGFKLVNGKHHLNLNKRQMLELIREFGNQIRKGGVGVFYFAGHGVQIDKRNYLIPITEAIQYQEDAEFEAVDVDQVLREMEYAENGLNILILDACRNNELPKKSRNARNGLVEPHRKPSGVFIAFAARDGQVALENSKGRNGLYTQELLKYLETPNLRLEDIFINTRREVKRLSNKTQEPIEYGSLDDIFYFKSNESVVSQPPPKPDSQLNSSPSSSPNETQKGDSSELDIEGIETGKSKKGVISQGQSKEYKFAGIANVALRLTFQKENTPRFTTRYVAEIYSSKRQPLKRAMVYLVKGQEMVFTPQTDGWYILKLTGEYGYGNYTIYLDSL